MLVASIRRLVLRRTGGRPEASAVHEKPTGGRGEPLQRSLGASNLPHVCTAFAEKPLIRPKRRSHGPQRSSLFASWSNHIAKSVNWVPETREEGDEDDGGGRDLVAPHDPRGGDATPEEEADPERVMTRDPEAPVERMEVADPRTSP